MLYFVGMMVRSTSKALASRVVHASVIYLPVVLGLMMAEMMKRAEFAFPFLEGSTATLRLHPSLSRRRILSTSLMNSLTPCSNN
jgi:hypothetical protein